MDAVEIELKKQEEIHCQVLSHELGVDERKISKGDFQRYVLNKQLAEYLAFKLRSKKNVLVKNYHSLMEYYCLKSDDESENIINKNEGSSPHQENQNICI